MRECPFCEIVLRNRIGREQNPHLCVLSHSPVARGSVKSSKHPQGAFLGCIFYIRGREKASIGNVPNETSVRWEWKQHS